MSELIKRLLAKKGKKIEEVVPWSRIGKILRRQGVQDTPELQRVLQLPRRDWTPEPELIDEMTDWLKRPGGTMRLKAVQAAALAEMHDFRGLLGPIRVGGGKTLISLMAGRVCGAERAVLLIPATLRDKTIREAERLAAHWIFPMPRIVSYEALGRVNGADLLQRLHPDLVVADECHKLKNTGAACTRRVGRYLTDPKYGARGVFMSGTITSKSLHDYAHLLQWSIPAALYPLPRPFPELAEWADCLDVGKDGMAPGALVQLCSTEELAEPDAVSAVRKAFRRRLTETPAVVATSDDVDCAASIQVTHIEVEINNESEFQHMRDYWETPDGWSFADAVELWRHATEMAQGFYYVWEPRPSAEWMTARKLFYADVRQILKHNQRQLDSVLQVTQAIDAGHYDNESLERWRAIKPTCDPLTVPVWIDHGVVEHAMSWMRREPGIVWVNSLAVLAAFEKRGANVFGRGGKNSKGEPIEEATGSIVASIQANGEGRNLQHWSRNLVLAPPSGGKVWEQLIGRTHRMGQDADEVTLEVLVNCVEQWAGFQTALADARYIQDTIGQEQKLLFADLNDVMTADAVMARKGAAWNRR